VDSRKSFEEKAKTGFVCIMMIIHETDGKQANRLFILDLAELDWTMH
jgi:hypothetical protein